MSKHKSSHNPQKRKSATETAGTGGSRVLRAAREASGAGRHGGRKPSRSAERRRAIQEFS